MQGARIDFSRIFFLLFACNIPRRAYVISLLFSPSKVKKRKRFTWNSCTHSRCFFAVKFSLECLAHVRAYRDRVRSRAMENPQMYLFFIFFFIIFFFPFFFFFAPVVRAIACKAAIRAFNLHALFLLTNG